ncbi:hypothetical protein [Rheinheimera sp. UJ63]|uniref:hypothetical protein n=1 Tax=Rheinheimera sp. UJ63 TaxID=2910157 RepID=UPI001F387F60|nr:hypothetical protein [Rheinheimera sp. UJ63]MCF4010557.1 hypothetical protein [Rheinheimera sp. UJ63]
MRNELPQEIKQKYGVSEEWQVPYAQGIELIRNGAQQLRSVLQENNPVRQELESIRDLLNDLEEFETDFFEIVEWLEDGEDIDSNEILEQIDNSGFIEGINEDAYENVLEVFRVYIHGEGIAQELIKPSIDILYDGFGKMLSARGLA